MGLVFSSWRAREAQQEAQEQGQGADDLDCVRLVLGRVGPRIRGRCACVNKTWKVAAAQAAPEDEKRHWLVDADGETTLWMLNTMTGCEHKVELNLPSDCVPTDEDFAHYLLQPTRVLCSFLGLLLVCLGQKYSYALIVGDPLLNKWVKLPRPRWASPPTPCMSLAGFCPSSGTLMVSCELLLQTATFNLQTAEWKVDPPESSPSNFGCPSTQACCLDGVFYSAFELDPGVESHGEVLASTIACYDPVNHRAWRRVKDLYLSMMYGNPIFLAASQSRDGMLVYMLPDGMPRDDRQVPYELYEAVKARGSTDLEFVRSPLMDGKWYKGEVKLFENEYDQGDDDDDGPMFYGKNGMYFWEHKDTIAILSDKEVEVQELKCTRPNSSLPPSKCYHAVAPGTQELMASLESKLL